MWKLKIKYKTSNSMKILRRRQQNELLDFICEQYLVAMRSNQKGIMNINQFGAIQSRVFRMAELVAGRTGYARISDRMASMNIKPKEEGNE